MKVNRGSSLKLQSGDSTRKEWQDIREGLKLRNIVGSIRANEASQKQQSAVDNDKCIIQRKLGHKELMPGSA